MKRFYLLPALAVSANCHAHYIPENQGLEVNASIAATWSSSDVVDEYDYWQIPGTVMGGHAWPREKGVQIDELSLALGSRFSERAFAVVELGSHAGDEDHENEVELQHAYLGFVCCDTAGPWVIEIGQMSAAFSPGLAEHAADRMVSDAPLVNDVFFGRDFHDRGIRLWWHESAGFSAGAELWRGDAFPATSSGDNAWDLFARYQWQVGDFSASFGGWYYQASASSRADHRYGGGHEHTPVAPPGTTATVFPDVRFTGDTDVYGVHGEMGYRLSPSWHLGVKTELMWTRFEGILHDASSRQASVDSDQWGGWVQPYLRWQKHSLGLRGDWLSTDNQLVGAAASVLATDSGLANPEEHDPNRITVFWHWQWLPSLALRTELVQDNTLPDEDLRWLFGVVWQDQLWPGGAGSGAHQH